MFDIIFCCVVSHLEPIRCIARRYCWMLEQKNRSAVRAMPTNVLSEPFLDTVPASPAGLAPSRIVDLLGWRRNKARVFYLARPNPVLISAILAGDNACTAMNLNSPEQDSMGFLDQSPRYRQRIKLTQGEFKRPHVIPNFSSVARSTVRIVIKLEQKKLREIRDCTFDL
ncbi:MAG: hypothetical protein WDO17_24705 [Alphaproteobacteria bacterium]